MTLPFSVFKSWLAMGERGISSETIVGHLTGVHFARHQGEPLDPSDFRRCEMLLRAVPLARLEFAAMKTASPVWARLVDAWDELVVLLDEESHLGHAPRLYQRMKELRAGAEVSS
jgi:hypothetical protein